MPELPDVEGFRTFTDRHATGRTIVRARALDDWLLKDISPSTLARKLRSKRIVSTSRRGKVLLVHTGARPDDLVIALHFGMTGEPVHEQANRPIHRWDRLVLTLDDSYELRYRNMRRLGFIRLTRTDRVDEALGRLGPEPLDVSPTWLRDALGSRKRAIKPLLVDQSFLAGIGNIYADEALLAARIHPSRPANRLTGQEVARLHHAIRRTLTAGIRQTTRGRMTPELPLGSRRRKGETCPQCSHPLRTSTVGGRTAYFCPSCQS